MVDEGFDRNVFDQLLKFLHPIGAGEELSGGWVNEAERSESVISCEVVGKLLVAVGRQLPDELDAVLVGYAGGLVPVGGLNQEGNLVVVGSDSLEKILTCKFPAVRTVESKVRNHSEDVLPVSGVKSHGLVICPRQKKLRTASHAELCAPLVESLADGSPVLLDQKPVHLRQVGGNELDRVLYKQNHLYVSLLGIVVHVHAVLYKLNHGKEDRRVAEPVEHEIYVGAVLALEDLCLTVVGRRRERDERKIRVNSLDLFCKDLHPSGTQIQHGDDQIEVELSDHFQSLGFGAHMSDFRRVGQTEGRVLLVELLFHSSVFLEHEAVILGAHEKHVVDVLQHQG